MANDSGKKYKKSVKPDKYYILNRELDSLPIKEVYPVLIEKLQIDIKRAGFAELRDLIAQSSEDKRLAGYIYAVAIEDKQRVQDAFDEAMGVWIVEAREYIADLKKEKLWDGQVYPTDVERWIAANRTDWGVFKEKLRKADRIVKAAKALWEAYESRLGSLQTYARQIEKRVEHSLEERSARTDERTK
jgi:hypothetical protein